METRSQMEKSGKNTQIFMSREFPFLIALWLPILQLSFNLFDARRKPTPKIEQVYNMGGCGTLIFISE